MRPALPVLCLALSTAALAQERRPAVSGEIARDAKLEAVTFPAGQRWLTWAVDVPAGAEGLVVVVRARARVDLFLRHGEQIRDYARDPDHRAQGPGGDALLLVDAASSPPLRPGRYYLDAVRPEGVEVPPFELLVRIGRAPAMAYVARARASREAGQAQDALRDCQAALALEPRLAEARAERARVRAALGDRSGAAEDHALAVELDPGLMRGVADVAATGTFTLASAPAGQRLRALMRLRVPAGCRRLRVAAVDAGVDVDLHLRHGLPPEGREADHTRVTWRRDEQLWLEPGDVPVPLLAGTWWLVVDCPTGGPGQRPLQVGVEYDPPDPRADPRWWFDRGLMHAQARRPEAALRALTLAAQSAPQDPFVELARADALKELGRWRDAIAAYARVLTLAPEFPGVNSLRLGRATCLREVGDRTGALRDLDLVEQALPRLADAPWQRSQVLLATDPAGALAALDRALELEPGHWRALVARAQLRAARGDRDAARADHDAAVLLAPAQVLAAGGLEGLLEGPRTQAVGLGAGKKRRGWLVILPADVFTLTLDLRGVRPGDWIQVALRWGVPPHEGRSDYVTLGPGAKRVVLSRDSVPPLRPGPWYVEVQRDQAGEAAELELSLRWTREEKK